MTRTILLADDSVTIQKVVELTFMDEDFRVVPVGSGSEAIERLDEVRPDFVIADVHMPGADGYEVCRRVREALPATPVLLLVGTFESFDAERAEQVGASGFLKKPFDSQELLRRAKELLQAPAASLPRVAVTPAPMPMAMEMAEEEPLVAIEEHSWSPEPAPAPAWSTEPEPAPAWAPAAAPTAAADWHLDAPTASADEWQLEAEPVAEPELAPALEPAAQPLAAAAASNGLSEADVDRIAHRVVELLGERVVRDVAWEVVPDLAEVLLKARIRELEAAVE